MSDNIDDYNLDVAIMLAGSMVAIGKFPESYNHKKYLDTNLDCYVEEIADLAQGLIMLFHFCDLEKKGVVELKDGQYELTDKGKAAHISM